MAKKKKIMKNKNIKKLITHNGSFHTDDVFAAATLSLLMEKRGEKFQIIRTRSKKLIKEGDYVFDLGTIYSEKNNRFDHHQVGGAGKRKNSVEYSSFGLVWKKFGNELSGSREIAKIIDEKLVEPIDAYDNGIDIYKSKFSNLAPYDINVIVSSFNLTALEKDNENTKFLKMVELAKAIIQREIKIAKDEEKIKKIIQDQYYKIKDRKIIIIEKPEVSREEIWNALQDFPEPLFIVYKSSDSWRVVVMRKEKNSFKARKDLPKKWSGLRDEKLQKVTGVKDAIFCLRQLFLASAKSKEGALRLAELALKQK